MRDGELNAENETETHHQSTGEQANPIERQPAELDRVREVILAAYPDLVPELVVGATVGELLDAVDPARAAFAALRERLTPVVPVVPAGTMPATVDPGDLPTHELLRRGIAARQSAPGERPRR